MSSEALCRPFGQKIAQNPDVSRCPAPASLTTLAVPMSPRWLLVLFSLASSGCATLFSSSSDEVTFTSEPEGAEVVLDGEVVGRTPLSYELERTTFRRSEVLLRKDGYRSERIRVRKALDTVALFNCTSVLSWGTDALTGAMMEYSPNKYFVELETKGARSDRGHLRALAFVLVHHEDVARALARRSGASLDALAELFGVTAAEHPRFMAALGEDAPRLVRYDHPHQLFRALRRTLDRAGFSPADCGCTEFDNGIDVIPAWGAARRQAVRWTVVREGSPFALALDAGEQR